MGNTTLILALKIVVMSTWLVASAGFFFPVDSRFGQAGRSLIALLAFVHLLECAAFYRTLKRTGRPIGLELANTFFFGVAHFVEARALAEATALIDAAEDSR